LKIHEALIHSLRDEKQVYEELAHKLIKMQERSDPKIGEALSKLLEFAQTKCKIKAKLRTLKGEKKEVKSPKARESI
jgi:hypothetical protein